MTNVNERNGGKRRGGKMEYVSKVVVPMRGGGEGGRGFSGDGGGQVI